MLQKLIFYDDMVVTCEFFLKLSYGNEKTVYFQKPICDLWNSFSEKLDSHEYTQFFVILNNDGDRVV